MAMYHFETNYISRANHGKRNGRNRTSVASQINYITGRKIHDNYNGETYYKRKNNPLFYNVFLPANAPPAFYSLQCLCDAINNAERRYDARTAREFICSLPNELPVRELEMIVSEFITHNFVDQGLCAVAAIHEGRNKEDPLRNNPHVHIIVPTRAVTPEGFDPKKEREHDKEKYIHIWREQWATVLNRAYERNRLDIRVSHESLKVQGIKREPTIRLSPIDWQREQRGERTLAGDENRAIRERNKQREKQRQLERERELEVERSRSR